MAPFKNPDDLRRAQRDYWRRKKGLVPCEKTLKAFDAWPYCMHGMFTSDPCFRAPMIKQGAWRGCFRHPGSRS